MPAKRGRSTSPKPRKTTKRTSKSKSPKRVTKKKSTKSSKKSSTGRLSCKYTNRGCTWSLNGARKTVPQLKAAGVTTARMARLRATAKKRALSRGVSKGRTQPVLDTKGPQCIIRTDGKCRWYLHGKPTKVETLLKKGFTKAQLAAAKKRASGGAIRKGVRASRSKSPAKRKTKSKSPKRKSKSPKRKASKSPAKKTKRKTKSKSPKRKSSRKANSYLKAWVKAAKSQGYMGADKSGKFKKLPKKGTKGYLAIRKEYLRLLKK